MNPWVRLLVGFVALVVAALLLKQLPALLVLGLLIRRPRVHERRTGTLTLVLEPLAFLLPFSEAAPRPAPTTLAELERAYAVRCDDPAFAGGVLGGPLVDRLLQDEDGWGFELGAGHVVAYRPSGRREALDALEALKGFPDRPPSELRSARSA